jgi:hypothetical protein
MEAMRGHACDSGGHIFDVHETCIICGDRREVPLPAPLVFHGRHLWQPTPAAEAATQRQREAASRAGDRPGEDIAPWLIVAAAFWLGFVCACVLTLWIVPLFRGHP